MLRKTPRSQIFGDGDNLVIFFGESIGMGEFAYTFEQPIITCVKLGMADDTNEVIPPLFAGAVIDFKPTTINFTIEGVCKTECSNVQEGKNLFPKLGIFKNVSVSDLFRVINQKISKRENGDD